MKLAYCLDELILCGGLLVPFEHCRELRKRGYEASIYANGRNEKLQKEFPTVPVKDIKELASFTEEDIIIAVWWIQCPQLEQYKGRKIQFVQGNDIVGNIWEDYKKNCKEIRSRKNWEIIAVSKYAGDWTGREYQIIPNGLNQEWFIDHKLERDICYLIEGNDEPNKNINKAYELAKCISNNIAWLTRENNFKYPVKVFENPPREEIPKIYQRAKVFIKLSNSEGFCLPALEAMASGCLVITKDMGGNDFCLDGINCIKRDTWQNYKFIDKIKEFSKDKEVLIKQGYETAKKYTIEKTVNKLLDTLQNKK